MRFLTSISALLLLAACASAPAAPSTPTTPSAPAAASSRVGQLLSSAGRENAASRADIERALGQPAIVRQEGAGAALTYRYENCALLLLFAADGRNVMRLTEAHPSARQTGQVAPSLEQCAAEAGR